MDVDHWSTYPYESSSDALADVSVGALQSKRSKGGRRRALSLHHMQIRIAWHLAYPDAYLGEADIVLRSRPLVRLHRPLPYHTIPYW